MDLTRADLTGAYLGGAYLLGAQFLIVEQLIEAKTLYQAKMYSAIKAEVMKIKPTLFAMVGTYADIHDIYRNSSSNNSGFIFIISILIAESILAR